MNIIVGAIPPRYHWLATIAGMEGDLTEGLIELQNLFNDLKGTPYEIYREEIIFYFGDIYSSFSFSK